jgi:hypothetical protein
MIQNSANKCPIGELFAESETRFWRNGVDATFTFERDAGRRVNALLIRIVNSETTKASKTK